MNNTETLRQQLQSEDVNMRHEALFVCSKMRDLPADDAMREIFVTLLQSDDAEVRRAAVMALSNMGDDASSVAIALQLRDTEPKVRRRVCAYLLKHPYKTALVAPLIEVLHDDHVDYAGRDFAAMTLASGEHRQALPAIVQMMDTGPKAIYRRMVHCMIRMPDASALPALRRIHADEDVDERTRKVAKRAMQIIENNTG
jgi:HEAT repeat protein